MYWRLPPLRRHRAAASTRLCAGLLKLSQGGEVQVHNVLPKVLNASVPTTPVSRRNAKQSLQSSRHVVEILGQAAIGNRSVD